MNPLIKSFLLFIALAIVLLIGYEIAVSVSHSGKSKLTIVVAPSTAKTFLDGKPVKQGTIYVSYSIHHVSAKLDNFYSQTKTIDTRNQKDSSALLLLSPSNGTGAKYLTDNIKYQMERESLASQQLAEQSNVPESGLLSKLPYDDISGPFSIDYGDSSTRTGGVAIIISNSAPSGRLKAINWIRQQGYDPTTLEITYLDFGNPLLGESGRPK